MSKRFKKLSHTIYECKYHIVCCLKYRHRIFKDEIKEYTNGQVYSLCGQKDLVEVLALNIQEDHIHLVLSIPPKYSVSSVMGFIKRKLTLRVSTLREIGKAILGGGIYGVEDIVLVLSA